MCSRPAFLPIPTTVAPIPTTAAPIPTAADISGRSNPGQRRRLPASRPRSKTAEEDGCADRWPLVEHFPDVQSFSGSEVFLEEEGMTTPSRKRLMRERLQQDPPAGISAAPQDNSTFKMTLRVDT
ncbi:Ubiquitin-conjugating enzyme E2 1 [Linum perenne]